MSSDELAALGIKPGEFTSMTQRQIEEKLDSSFPGYINDCKLLDIYTKWLSKQVSKLGYKSSLDTSQTIRNGCNFLSARNYDKGVVISAFWRLKEEYVKDHPGGKREFNFAKRDIEINYKRLSNSASISIAPSEGSVKGLKSPSLMSNTPKSDLEGSRTTTDESKYDMVLRERLEKVRSENNMEFAPPVPPKGLPPPSYVCRRCKVPGHYIQNCTTNGNPSFDCPPPKGYVCRHCGEAETHFVSACPRLQLSSPSKSTTGSRSQKKPKSSRTELKCDLPAKPNSSSVSGIQSTPPPITKMDPHSSRGDMIGLGDLNFQRRTESRSPARTPKGCDNHMNEEREKYINSNTDPNITGNPESRKIRRIVGGGPLRSGSNNDPIGRGPRRDSRRQLNSCRPDSSMIQKAVIKKITESDCTINKQQPMLPHPSRRRDSDGRLSPWDDLQPLVKKRHRDDSPQELPWDGVEISPPKKRMRDKYKSYAPVFRDSAPSPDFSGQRHLSRTDAFDELAKGEHIADRDIARSDTMEYLMPRSFADEYEEAVFEAESFLEMFEWELSNRIGIESPSSVDTSSNSVTTQPPRVCGSDVEQNETASSGSDATAQKKLAFAGKTITSPASPKNDDRDCFSSPCSPATFERQYRLRVAPAFGKTGGETFLTDLPKAMAGSRHISCEIGPGLHHCSKFIQPFQTLKTLGKDPPYDRCVLELFRGRQHGFVYVNILRRCTAIDMYEEGEDTSSVRRTPCLGV